MWSIRQINYELWTSIYVRVAINIVLALFPLLGVERAIFVISHFFPEMWHTKRWSWRSLRHFTLCTAINNHLRCGAQMPQTILFELEIKVSRFLCKAVKNWKSQKRKWNYAKDRARFVNIQCATFNDDAMKAMTRENWEVISKNCWFKK